MTLKVLLTGFKPFHQYTENPSEFIARELSLKKINTDIIISRWIFDVNQDQVKHVVPALIEEVKPDLIFCFGLKASSQHIELETLAHNILYAKNEIKQQKIIEHAPLAFQENFNFFEFEDHMNEQHKEVSFKLSHHAGHYICNELIYLLHYYKNLFQMDYQSFFIHVPNSVTQELLLNHTSTLVTKMIDRIEVQNHLIK